MIRHLRYDDINKDRWDDVIARSFNGMVYAYSWYLDIVHPGWEALVAGDYETVFPLTPKKKFGIQYLAQPWFTQQLGVFTVNQQLTPDLVSDFIRAIPAQYRFVEINLNTFNRPDTGEYEVKELLTHHLDLIHSYEKIRSGYSENLERNIKKAKNKGITISADTDPGIVIRLFRKNMGRKLGKWKAKEYVMLEHLIYQGIHKGRARVWGAFTPENELTAGAFFFESNGKAVFHFSASDEEAKESGALPLLIDTFIRENAGRNIVFDFEGSVIPGLARFYRSFGSKECVYLQVRINRLPWYLHWLK